MISPQDRDSVEAGVAAKALLDNSHIRKIMLNHYVKFIQALLTGKNARPEELLGHVLRLQTLHEMHGEMLKVVFTAKQVVDAAQLSATVDEVIEAANPPAPRDEFPLGGSRESDSIVSHAIAQTPDREAPYNPDLEDF